MNVTVRAPHVGQRAILDDPERYHVAFCGRRWGKTEMGIYQILVGTEARPGACRVPGLYWWIGLSWRAASLKRAWRQMRTICRGWCEIREADKEIILPNGAEIWFRSSESPESLAGEGLHGVICDEFTMWNNGEQSWQEQIRPTLADFKGWADFVGIPKGRNWGWVLWQRGQDKLRGWRSWQMPSVSNPFLDPAEIEAARLDTVSNLFNQEYLAEVVEDGGVVFRNILAAIGVEPLEKAALGRHYVVGVDWGKHDDFTAITVLDEKSGEVVHHEAFNQIDYTLQRGRLMAVCERFNPTTVLAEENSIGEPNIEDLIQAGLPVTGFTTTHASKSLAIEALALAFERGTIHIPEDRALIGELQAFSMERLPSGTFRYEAPSGMHDDRVISLALAWYAAHGGKDGYFSFVEAEIERMQKAANG